MKKQYISPRQSLIVLDNPTTLLSGSGPNAGDQNNPSVNSRGMLFDDFDDYDEFED